MLTKSQVLTSAFLMGTALICSGCETANVRIPDSLRAPCEPTSDVSNATALADLSKAIIQGDADVRVCSARKDAVTAIAEARNKQWWRLW